MVDRSICIGGRPADAVYRDLSNGRASSDAVGLRHRELERVGAVPAIWRMPGYVLRVATSAWGRWRGLVQRSLACAVAFAARDASRVEGCDHFDATAISPSWATQALGEA